MQIAKYNFQPNNLIYPIHSRSTTYLTNIHPPPSSDPLVSLVSALLSELKLAPTFKLLLMMVPFIFISISVCPSTRGF